MVIHVINNITLNNKETPSGILSYYSLNSTIISGMSRPVIYTNWRPNEGVEGIECIVADLDRVDLGWRDQLCDKLLNYFLCEAEGMKDFNLYPPKCMCEFFLF